MSVGVPTPWGGGGSCRGRVRDNPAGPADTSAVAGPAVDGALAAGGTGNVADPLEGPVDAARRVAALGRDTVGVHGAGSLIDHWSGRRRDDRGRCQRGGCRGSGCGSSPLRGHGGAPAARARMNARDSTMKKGTGEDFSRAMEPGWVQSDERDVLTFQDLQLPDPGYRHPICRCISLM